MVANLPYIAEVDMASLAREIREFEPALALDGGCDGTVLIGELIRQAADKIRPGGAMLRDGDGRQKGPSGCSVFPDSRNQLRQGLSETLALITIGHHRNFPVFNTFVTSCSSVSPKL